MSIELCTGSHYQIGVQHGVQSANEMRRLLQAFNIDLEAPWQEAEFLVPLERHLPELAEEIHGIADGSGLGVRAVTALSFLIDLGTATSACTGAAFADGPDGPVVAKTCDCTPGVQFDWLNQRLVRPDGGLAADAALK